jgi:chemotaxis protein methyltransferase CheR
VLDDGKEYLVEARLAPVAEREGVGSVAELIGRVRTGAPSLREDVVSAMTTNETSFFRDLHPFEALRTTILPQVLDANGGRSLAMWSAAASTGQEAYSLALLVAEHFPSVPSVTILGTDLSRDVLERAAAGRFTQLEVNRGLPAALLVRHFERHGREWQVKPSIRRMVTFRQLNLTRSLPPLPPMDVVFLRNVLIYFDLPTRAQVLRAVAGVLRPEGYLFLGGAETTHNIHDGYEVVRCGRTVVFRLKPGRGDR